MSRRKFGRQLVAQLACDHYQHLLAFAASRLKRLGLDSNAAADLLHDAIHSVLRGLEGHVGRHPRDQDLQDMSSFLPYMKQVVKSLATNMGRHERCLFISSLNEANFFTPELNYLGTQVIVEPIPNEEPELRDLHRELFRRLQQRSPPRLRRMVSAWKRDFFWSESIPLRGAHRQYRAELREIAQQIVGEIEPTLIQRRESRAFRKSSK